MKTLVLIFVKIFFISALFIISNGNLDMKDSGQREVFFEAYFNWVSEVFHQSAELAGYVVNSRWLPENEFLQK